MRGFVRALHAWASMYNRGDDGPIPRYIVDPLDAACMLGRKHDEVDGETYTVLNRRGLDALRRLGYRKQRRGDWVCR